MCILFFLCISHNLAYVRFCAFLCIFFCLISVQFSFVFFN